MANPRSRITADVSTNWPQMLMRLNVIGVRRLGERITMASDLFSFMTSPLSQSHVFYFLYAGLHACESLHVVRWWES